MDFEEVAPEPAGLIESVASFGYSVSSSLADLVDNSIAADATGIEIDMVWGGADSWVAISDDGTGMTEERLVTAMTLAARWGADRGRKDLGRFGMGLKSASFAHARLLMVTTSTDGKVWHTRTWDRDLIDERGRWLLGVGTDSRAEGPLRSVLSKRGGPGTVVLWQNLSAYAGTEVVDKKAKIQFHKEGERAARHLGVTFHRFLSRIRPLRLTVNGSPIAPWDPFMLDHPSTLSLPPDEMLLEGSHLVTASPFVLPSLHRLTEEQKKVAAGENGWLNQQGLYVYRRERLIAAGGWYGLRKREERYNQARIAVDIPTETDALWKIDVKKSTARPPISLRPALSRIADRTCKKAADSVRSRGRVTTMRRDSRLEFAWTLGKRNDGTIVCKINREHSLVKALLSEMAADQEPQVKAVLRLLEEALPIAGLRVLHETDEADDPEPFEGGSPESDMEAVAGGLYDMLLGRGRTPAEARKSLRAMPPFDELDGFWNHDEGDHET